MENKLTEQEVQRIMKNAEQELDRMAARLKQNVMKELGRLLGQGNSPKSKGSISECEDLIDSMVSQMTAIDGMETGDFRRLYRSFCELQGVQDVLSDKAISERVKSHGYTIVDKKISHPGDAWKERRFKRLPRRDF